MPFLIRSLLTAIRRHKNYYIYAELEREWCEASPFCWCHETYLQIDFYETDRGGENYGGCDGG
jgi:hypothetical protein